MWKTVVLFSVLLAAPSLAFAHLDHLVGCKTFGFVKGHVPARIDPPRFDDSTGLLLEMYSVADHKWGTLSHTRDATLGKDGVVSVRHSPFPTFYMVGDATQITLVYIDKVGLGKCKDIVLYEDLRFPIPNGSGVEQHSRTLDGRVL